MSDSIFKAVCDAGPVIHLDEMGVLYLIEDFQEILICPAVRNEVQKKRPNLFLRISPPFVAIPHAIPTDQTLIAIAAPSRLILESVRH